MKKRGREKKGSCAKNVRIHPDGGLEADGKGAFKDEEHRRGGLGGLVGDGGVVLDLVDEGGLDGHNGGHERDHGQEQRAAADAVDEEPGNEAGEEEPGLQEAGHEAGKVLVEADRFVEEGAAVVDDGVDSAELLEDLDGARDEKAAARVELVA